MFSSPCTAACCATRGVVALFDIWVSSFFRAWVFGYFVIFPNVLRVYLNQPCPPDFKTRCGLPPWSDSPVKRLIHEIIRLFFGFYFRFDKRANRPEFFYKWFNGLWRDPVKKGGFP